MSHAISSGYLRSLPAHRFRHLISQVWENTEQRRSLHGEQFDVVVIGGGINGVAIARQCSAAGRRVLLAEQHDFASGTTSRTTRIIHGGLRYLEYGEIALVRESLREREALLRRKPHLVRPLRFVLALPPGRRSALEVRFGLWLYRRVAPARPCANGHNVAALERMLDRGDALRVFHYDDAQCDFPERLVAEWLRDAVSFGAEARNYTQALQVDVANGCACGVRLRDRLNGCEYRVATSWIINASGPWADRVARTARVSGGSLIGGVRGSHIVLPRFTGAPDAAVYTEAIDGRPIFVLPWNDQLWVGTTEVRDSGDPGRVQPHQQEIDYLLRSARRLFPAAGWQHGDIQYAMAGVRPLPFSTGAAPSAITRRHLLHDHREDGAGGMISLVGGKLTTAAGVARECARKLGIVVDEPRADALLSDHGIEGAVESLVESLAAGGLPRQTARALMTWFGRPAHAIAQPAEDRLRAPICDRTPHIVAEAVYAIRQEFAVTLADVLLRRVPVALAGWWSEAETRQSAQRIGAALGWSETRINEECEAFEQERSAFLLKTRPGVPAGIP